MPTIKAKLDFMTLVRQHLPAGSKPKAAEWTVVRQMADTQKRLLKASESPARSKMR